MDRREGLEDDAPPRAHRASGPEDGHRGDRRSPGRRSFRRRRFRLPWRFHPAALGSIAVGGALGTCARVGVAEALPTTAGRFPWATFAVNVSGALLLGFVMVLVVDRLPPTRLVRPLIATGLCGAFTTFSTLVTELDLEIRAGRLGLAATYLAGTVVVGLAAALAGMALARVVPKREGLQ